MRPRFVFGKVLGALSTLVFVVVVNFFLFRIVNDDPVESMFRGRNLSADQKDRLRQQFNLDGSKLQQFWAYARELVSGNLGISLQSRRPVTTEIGEDVPSGIIEHVFPR